MTHSMHDTLNLLWPELVLFAATCVVMVVGLSPNRAVRNILPFICAIALGTAGVLAARSTATSTSTSPFPLLPAFAKPLIAFAGLLILPLMSGVVDRDYESYLAVTRSKFNALRSTSAEFYAFFLFSLTGLMLCASASDLIWLFLALELTSLPTYVMIAMGSSRSRSLESAVKYFFLGALGAATFMFGFALIFGATGYTDFPRIAASIQDQLTSSASLSPLLLTGFILSILGLCFKVAAVPMHYYTADVYQGAPSPIAAMLAFVPKAAGFIALILLLSTLSWSFGSSGHALPEPIYVLLWALAVLTMTTGNVLALRQTSIKRMLAYSSIAHSGYMFVGLIAGPSSSFTTNGISAILFYLLAYAIMNTGAFAVLASLERKAAAQQDEPLEADDAHDIKGLWQSHPMLAVILAVCAFGLLGLPPLVGFFSKLPLFSATLANGHYYLVLILGLNSAIAAFYYLRLVALPFLENKDTVQGESPLTTTPFPYRQLAAMLCAAGVIAFSLFSSTFATQAHEATLDAPSLPQHNAATATIQTPISQN